MAPALNKCQCVLFSYLFIDLRNINFTEHKLESLAVSVRVFLEFHIGQCIDALLMSGSCVSVQVIPRYGTDKGLHSHHCAKEAYIANQLIIMIHDKGMINLTPIAMGIEYEAALKET